MFQTRKAESWVSKGSTQDSLLFPTTSESTIVTSYTVEASKSIKYTVKKTASVFMAISKSDTGTMVVVPLAATTSESGVVVS